MTEPRSHLKCRGVVCDRYPDRVVLPLEATMTDAPERIRESMIGTCTHGHDSHFEGSTFYCGGTLE